MKEAQIVSWDDLELAAGRRVPAEGTVILALNGMVREVDVSTDNRDAIEEFLRPYLNAGRKPEVPVPVSRGYNYRPGARADRAAMRDWADRQVAANPSLAERYSYITPSGNFYYPQALKEDYAAVAATERRPRH